MVFLWSRVDEGLLLLGFCPNSQELLLDAAKMSLEYGWRAAFYLLTRTYYHKYRLYTIRGIVNKWAPPVENKTSTYIKNVSRLTGIDPDEPIGIPLEKPSRWMAVGVAIAIQENGTDSLDYFAMLRGWEMARSEIVTKS